MVCTIGCMQYSVRYFESVKKCYCKNFIFCLTIGTNYKIVARSLLPFIFIYFVLLLITTTSSLLKLTSHLAFPTNFGTDSSIHNLSLSINIHVPSLPLLVMMVNLNLLLLQLNAW